MKCEQVKELLTQYLLGDLNETRSAEVRAHLEKCGGCQALMREIEPTLDLLRDALAAPSKAPKKLSIEQKEEIVRKVSNPVRKIVFWMTAQHPRLTRTAAVLVMVASLWVVSGKIMWSIYGDIYSNFGKALPPFSTSPLSGPIGPFIPMFKMGEVVSSMSEVEVVGGGSGAARNTENLNLKMAPLVEASYDGKNEQAAEPAGAAGNKVAPAGTKMGFKSKGPTFYSIVHSGGGGGGASKSAPSAKLSQGKHEAEDKPVGSSSSTLALDEYRSEYGKYPARKAAAPAEDVGASLATPEGKAEAMAPAAPHTAAPAAGAAGQVESVNVNGYVNLNDMIQRPKPAYIGTPSNMKDVNLDPAERGGAGGSHLSLESGQNKQDAETDSSESGLLGGAIVGGVVEKSSGQRGGSHVAAKRAEKASRWLDQKSGEESVRRTSESVSTLGKLIEGNREQDGRSNVGRQAWPEAEAAAGGGTVGRGDRNVEESVVADAPKAYEHQVTDYYKAISDDRVSAPAKQQPGFVVGLPVQSDIKAIGRLSGEKKKAEKSGELALATKGFSGTTAPGVDLSGVGNGVGGDIDEPVADLRPLMTKSPVILKGLYGGGRTKEGRELALKSYGGGGGGDKAQDERLRQATEESYSRATVANKPKSAESRKDVAYDVATPGKKEKAGESKGEGKRGGQLSKLDSIVIPEIDFKQANIRDVVEFLRSSSEPFDKSDDKSEGVNIVLQLSPGSGAAAALAADPFAAAPAAEPQPGSELITFSARNLPLKQAIKIVADYSGLKVKEEDNVIRLVPKDAPEDGKVLQSKKELEDKKEQEDKIAARFKAVGVNPFVYTAQNPFSTFGIDCDTASYTLTRNYMSKGFLPPAEAVRTEEFVNFFDYAYRAPDQETFKVYAEVAPSKFGRGGLKMIKIGVKGRRLGREEQRRAVLTFLVDTSGSMETADRIGLAKKSLRMLVEKLNPQDLVTIVKYDSHAKLVIENVPASEKKKILDAIDNLQCSGSTNLEEGMEKAYAVAARNFVSKGENRVLLMSDGVANLGDVAAAEILKKIEKYRKQGIFCSVFGLGIGSYNDEMLQELAGKGDGTYKFIDSEEEAKRVFVDDLAANLNTIAKDVKIQVEFNEKRVNRYRQIGYESRQLKKEDFRNDKIDAGEVGSGQSVTALYEAEVERHRGTEAQRHKGDDRIATVRVRYQRVDNGEVEEIERPITSADMIDQFDKADVRFRLAACAAEFAEILRGSPYAEGRNFTDVARVLAPIAMELELDGRVQELKKLVTGAGGLSRGE